jgi:hypothetical protein
MTRARRNYDGIEIWSWLAWLALLAVLVSLAVMALMSVGAAYGAGTGLVNYGRALRDSIQPERPAV